MAEGVLGLGSGQAASLNNDLIDKLKEAERKATVEPLETQIEDITKEGGESETLQAIIAKANEFLETIKPFDLFVSGGITAFDQKSATTSGSSVVFDAVDETSLNTGSTSVTINSLATRDVFQTAKFSDKDSVITGSDTDDDDLVINHASIDYRFETNGKTYQELADDINANSNFNATVEEVGSGEFRIVIKSTELGIDNALTISQEGTLDLGFSDDSYTATNSYSAASIAPAGDITIDGVTFSLNGTDETYSNLATKINLDASFTASYADDKLTVTRVDGSDISVSKDDFNFNLTANGAGKTVSAENMVAIVDGVNYNSSSNSIVVDGGLKITAVETGTSTINVEKDTTTIASTLQTLVSNYNELVAIVDLELYSAESSIEDKATLRTMMESIKGQLFNSYGPDQNLSIFNFGFELAKDGSLSVDTEKINEAIANDLDNFKMLLIGTAANEGLGTQLKVFVDSLDGFDGILTKYEENMNSRKDSLEEEKENAIEDLDNKYSLLAQQFAAYGSIITQFENSFSGLSLMIEQSTAG